MFRGAKESLDISSRLIDEDTNLQRRSQQYIDESSGGSYFNKIKNFLGLKNNPKKTKCKQSIRILRRKNDFFCSWWSTKLTHSQFDQ